VEEGTPPAYAPPPFDTLQWGHVNEDVEETSSTMQIARSSRTFNGATSMKTWKRSGHLATPTGKVRPSMGPRQ